MARTAAAATPHFDESFKDFAISAFDAEDSIVRVQKCGELVISTSMDCRFSIIGAYANTHRLMVL